MSSNISSKRHALIRKQINLIQRRQMIIFLLKREIASVQQTRNDFCDKLAVMIRYQYNRYGVIRWNVSFYNYVYVYHTFRNPLHKLICMHIAYKYIYFICQLSHTQTTRVVIILLILSFRLTWFNALHSFEWMMYGNLHNSHH